MTGRVAFVGAGPGAADLITLRGARRLAEADVVVWAPSVVEVECVREHARPGAELVDFSRVTESEVVEVYRRAAASGQAVVRLHAGDPATWGGLREQHDACLRLGLEIEVVPGVTQVSAAAASVGRELTTSEVAQSLLLASPESAEHVRELAAHGTTLALSASAARADRVAEQLRAGGYADTTPVVIAYKVSLPDAVLVRTTLGELESAVKEHKLYRSTLFLVGDALRAPVRRGAPIGDEPVRQPRASKWRAARAPGAESRSEAAWSAVHDLQETARSRWARAREESGADGVELPVARSLAEPGGPAEITESAESGPVAEALAVDALPGQAGSPEQEPSEPRKKPPVAAARKRTVSVQASTTPRKPAPARGKKPKRTG
ncbi:cobalt-precorrin-4 C(11)-methyltransferase [Actinosynnema pretiosum subsp. pretiosum]|uniref:Cobalt-precorrin-4 C(11)-methyltransferase n=1 Tax=Actinosynnema pretiosum subsp. pretiosum TaxID=103721 RepID=A0AA45R2P2_9PSEU|nr:cobalt-precorrin-4 C(11)-methyltransferase [Actinosynnema pretiosum subsp. pretiosum]